MTNAMGAIAFLLVFMALTRFIQFLIGGKDDGGRSYFD
jgi:hypothetical protein